MAQQKHQQEDISVEDVNVTRQVYVPASVLDQLRSQGDFAKRVKALLMAVFTMDEIINNNTMGSDGLGQLDASRLSALREQLAAMTPGEHVNPHGAAYMKKVHRIINARCRKIRRNRVYRAISGLLTYGLQRGPPGTYYIYNEDLLDVVRDAYPSSEDVNWMLTNQDNRPTKEAPLYKVDDFVVVPGAENDGKDIVPWFARVIVNQPSARRLTVQWHVPNGEGEPSLRLAASIRQTTEVTSKKIKDSRGGVLFIDEAYRLTEADSSSKDVGKEALEELMSVKEGGDLVMIFAGCPDEMASFLDDTVQAPVALGDPHLGVLIYPGQPIDAELVRDGASASGYHRRLMDLYFYFNGFPSPGKISYIPVWSHSVVAARTARTLAMAAPVPVLRGDVTLVGGSLMEVWKKEDEDAAAEREEYREEWDRFEEDMAYLAHLERIMDAEDSSEDKVEEARRLYDQHVQVMNQFGLHGRRNIICPVVTDARCRASLESSVVSKDELQTSAELIVSQDRCFASAHVLYVEESLDRTNIGVVRVKASDFSCLGWVVSVGKGRKNNEPGTRCCPLSCTCVNDTECDHPIPVYECKEGVKPAEPGLTRNVEQRQKDILRGTL
ncbi:hypothetical protein Bbelb_351070 [Branchiostoma belcheri]|nr:hypothetical protein Bbelb_351070 [Branchiostoma belcheri]